jgi:pyruvate carboxylase
MGVKITDTTMRDGHQSLLTTRMRTEDMEEEEGLEEPFQLELLQLTANPMRKYSLLQ